MRKIIALALISVSLSGCATIGRFAKCENLQKGIPAAQFALANSDNKHVRASAAAAIAAFSVECSEYIYEGLTNGKS